MAQKKDYGLPDETLQLIAAAPELFAGGKYLQQRGDTRLPGSDLIAALRGDGTNNPGFSQYANGAGPQSASARTARRGLFAPAKLSMGRVTRDVTLPGAETQVPTRRTRVVVDPVIFDDEVIDDPVIDDPVIDDPVVDPVVDPVGTPVIDTGPPTRTVIDDFGTGTQVTVDGGTGNDTITGGTGNDGLDINTSIASILASRLGGTGGTGGGDGGSGAGGTGGLTGTGTTGSTGTTKTTTAATSTSSGTGTLRDAITRAVGDGTASVDGTASGADAGAGSSSLGSSLTADQLAALTKPKVPSVTLESSGPALDDQGALSATYDYPELLSPEELKAYEAWMATQGGGGAVGGGKPADDTYGNILEM